MILLSHYTNEQGLFGIVRSQTLWATNFLALNDRVEFVYAMSEIFHEAFTCVLPQICTDLKDKIKTWITKDKFIELIRARLKNSDGYRELYVTSFARGRNEREHSHGNLTLWDRYTRCEGYCLQFHIARMRKLIETEKSRHSYAWIELADIVYGVDKLDAEFQYLCEQYSLRILEDAAIRSGDYSIFKSHEKSIASDLDVFPRMLRFCARHKHPDFIDECEMRLLAYPTNETKLRVFAGTKTPKPIYSRRTGPGTAKYLVLGEYIAPGVSPDKIIIGPKAHFSVENILDLYPMQPKITTSDIPIA